MRTWEVTSATCGLRAMQDIGGDQEEHVNHSLRPAHAAKTSPPAHRRSALYCTCDWRVRSAMHMCRSSSCSIGLRSVLAGRWNAVLMRARRALGVAELAGRDGRMIGPGCRTVMADRQRLLEQRGPSMEFAPMRGSSFRGEKELVRVKQRPLGDAAEQPVFAPLSYPQVRVTV